MPDYQAMWNAAAHRVQTAIGLSFSLELPWLDERLVTFLKHIRVGVDTNKSDTGALVGLLVKKGVITDLEWSEASVAGMQREADLQEKTLNEQFGTDKIHTL